MSLYSLNPCLIMFVIYMYLQKKGTKKSSDYGGWYMTTSLAVLMWVLSVIFSAMVSRHLTTIGFHQTSNHDQGFHQTSNHDGSFTRHLTTIRFHQTSNHDQGFHQTSNHDGGFTRHLTTIGGFTKSVYYICQSFTPYIKISSHDIADCWKWQKHQ